MIDEENVRMENDFDELSDADDDEEELDEIDDIKNERMRDPFWSRRTKWRFQRLVSRAMHVYRKVKPFVPAIAGGLAMFGKKRELEERDQYFEEMARKQKQWRQA